MQSSSLLRTTWGGSHGGVPPFDEVKPEEFIQAFEIAIANATTEMDAIANAPVTENGLTFGNTIEVMELAGQQLNKLSALFGVHCHNLNHGAVPEAQRTVGPLLAAFQDKVIQNQALFARIKAVNDTKATAGLQEDQLRLLKEKFEEFSRNGAMLNDDDKKKLTVINMRLASLFTTFSQNILEEEKTITWLTKEQVGGLPQSFVGALESAGKENGREGQYAVLNTRSSVEPFLTYADNRPAREAVFTAFIRRSANDNAFNNYATIREILKLRAERAQLLGFASHAAWRIETEMAKTPENAMELLLKVWPKAVDRVKLEVADMTEIAKVDSVDEIKPWDYRYYAEKVRLGRYNLDFNEVIPYMDCEKLREGMFWAASELHGLFFKQVTDVPVFHTDVRVWDVTRSNSTTGEPEHVGLFYFDPYCRPGKNSGAWMTNYRTQSTLLGETPIISNNCNFMKAAPGEPVLISWDDAITMFHEFGHGLHGLLSKVKYPTQSGTSVARDFVEFPSQLNEQWLMTNAILTKFTSHQTTGKPLPAELIQKIENAEKFNQGFKTVEYLSCALIDMKLHMMPNPDIDPATFEAEILRELQMPKEIVMRHRMSHFSHIFSTDSYSAGYYSYLWADALVADAAEAFEAAPGGFYDKELARKYYDSVLTAGNSKDPAAAFRAFRGRDVDTSALMKKRGFPV